MPRIAIPKVRDDRNPVEYRIKLDPKTNDDLLLYQKLYERTYGQRIEPKDLLEPIVQRFLANDRSFKRFKKEHTGSPISKTPNSSAPEPTS